MKLTVPLVAFVLLLTSLALAQDSSPALSPTEIVRHAVAYETDTSWGSRLHFMFKDEKRTSRLSQTQLMVETQEATAGLVLARDGRTLSPAERQAEQARLENYVHNPQELNKKRKQEKEDDERTVRILKALPDAFLYQEAGREPASETQGSAGEKLIRLDFRPNPDYSPPSRVEQVLTGMRGHLLINDKQHRIVKIDGTLEKEVGFGWGVLGHLDRGGRFFVEQADVDGQWVVSRMELSFTGRILLVKKLSFQSSDTFSDFRLVSSTLTFAQGVQLLEKEAPNFSAQAMSQSDPRGKSEEQAEEASCCDR